MLEFTFDPPVAHFGTTCWDLETVVGDGAVIRAYDSVGTMILERDIVLPLQEDGDQAPNFVGLISDRSNLKIVTITVGNTAAQIANGNPNAENGHWIACLDLRYGQAALAMETRQRAFAFNRPQLTSGNSTTTLAPFTPLPINMVNTTGGLVRASYTLSANELRLATEHAVIVLAGNASIGPNEILWVLTTGQTSSGDLLSVAGVASPVQSYQVDIGLNGTTDWSLGSGSLDEEVVIDGALPVLIRAETALVSSQTIMVHELELQLHDPIYDNGPVRTDFGDGAGGADRSRLQNVPPIGHAAFGVAVKASDDEWAADDFTICDPAGWTIDEVEVTAYQSGSPTAASTFTEVYLEILDGPPGLGGVRVAGSPLPTDNLLATGAVRNAWGGAYRTQIGVPLSSQRPLMDLRVRLPAPLTLAPGTYWLRYSLAGTGSSGPFVAPITVTNKASTGNARRFRNGAWQQLAQSTGDPQGVPFRLFGTRADPLGSFVESSPGCNASDLEVAGAPVIGGFVHAEIRNPTPGAFPFLGLGLSPATIPVCGCIAGHDYILVLGGSQYQLDIPTDITLCGIELYLQGLEFFAGNCALLPIEYTRTVRATIR